ncbi:MAG: MFS transporter [bacterium]
MNIKSSLQEIKFGFQPSFWVANFMELFERLAYYGQATILSIYLRDYLKFSEVETGQLSSIFGGLIYLLPIFAGALADRYGFRKAFSFAFGILAIGYFLIGSVGMDTFAGIYPGSNLFPILAIILILTAIGGSFIKPSVLGTIALTSSPRTKSFGYAIYYWLVNTGAAIGPILAFFVRDSFGISFVYIVSSVSCALMFLTTIFFFKEPANILDKKQESFKVIFKNIVFVLSNVKFMFFLLLYGLYWVLFWQTYIVVPFYVSDFISPNAPIEIILSLGGWTIMLTQLPLNRLTKNIPTHKAILTGFSLAALAWLVMYFLLPATQGQTINILFWKDVPLGIPIIMLGIFIFSIGEQTQAPRYYEYIADLAPEGQTALFQGYAFLPIAFAWGFGGTFGGWIYEVFVNVMHKPELIFLTIFFIGLLATILMWVYNKFVIKK